MESRLTNKTALPQTQPGNEGYACSNCNNLLFEADSRFEAGCGFPSFWKHRGNNVQQNLLTTYGRERIQLVCARCGQHLGHLFTSKVTPTGVRYCINGNAIVSHKL
jgi:peptide-methionine (R)-S-oxide reductase